MAGASAHSGDGPDVVVIGGGPAGSTCSTLLAQHGLRVRLFERERFPRFHIGESLIPETYWVLKRLNMLEKMKRSQFVRKYSVGRRVRYSCSALPLKSQCCSMRCSQ